ncbi:hypothetical protein FKM82_000374 [Ascaphus truei]
MFVVEGGTFMILTDFAAKPTFISDLYFEMIEGKLQSHGIILRDELKTLLHLCQTPADVEFAKQVIYRYHEENKNVMFGEFRFGPIFLRLCYELDLADAAFNLIKDQVIQK